MRVLHAEWTKLRSVQNTGWLVLAVVAGTVALSTMITLTTRCRPEGGDGCGADITRLSLSGVYLGQVAVVVLGVLMITNEHESGMIRATLAATPRRLAVFAAKAAVLLAIVLGAGMAGVLGSFLAGRNVLPGQGFTAANGIAPLSLGDEPTLRANLGTVLYLGLMALLGLGIGAIVRDTAVSIALILAALYVLPMVAAVIQNPDVREWIDKLAPMNAGLAIQATRNLSELPIGPWAGLGVFAAYAAAATVAGAVLFQLRDA
jgi:ABC-2 type transport system permease protein